MKTLIKNAIVVNENRSFIGSLLIDNDRISDVYESSSVPATVVADAEIDASGCYLLPGIIDTHVHFREPGLVEKADIESETRAAAAGGVTTYFDMPNTVPQTTTPEALDSKFWIARTKSHVNYSFFYGVTNTNVNSYDDLDFRRIPGVKLFMGSSTGNMLVDRREALENIFRKVTVPLVAHCEDTTLINHNMAEAKAKYGEDPDISLHPCIRSSEACYKSSSLAVKLAKEYGTRLHVAHLSTARELQLFEPNLDCTRHITAEAVVSHLWFTDKDYANLGALIKCNPAIKTESDRYALRKALTDGRITTIGTDHAPHLIKDKIGGAAKAMSGMPSIQFSLLLMLALCDEGVMTRERLVELMCHHPARLFGVVDRGYIRKGYKADLVIVKPHTPWRVSSTCIESKCGWSPFVGCQFDWQVQHTFVNGREVYSGGWVYSDVIGEEVRFEH
jgi:dihydroorotase